MANRLLKIAQTFRAIATKITQTIQQQLKRFKKVVTAETFNSVQTSVDLKNEGQVVLTASGSVVFEYIENGRPAGAKRPVQLINGKFELFPRLEQWRAIVVPTMSPWLLAETIHVKGIKPVPVIAESVTAAQKTIDEGQERIERELAAEISLLIRNGINVDKVKL